MLASSPEQSHLDTRMTDGDYLRLWNCCRRRRCYHHCSRNLITNVAFSNIFSDSFWVGKKKTGTQSCKKCAFIPAPSYSISPDMLALLLAMIVVTAAVITGTWRARWERIRQRGQDQLRRLCVEAASLWRASCNKPTSISISYIMDADNCTVV